MKNEKYEFIMKGGPALKAALFSVCQSVWTTEKFPENWRETTLIQLYKGKSPRNNLVVFDGHMYVIRRYFM